MPTAKRKRDEAMKRDMAVLERSQLVERNNDVVTVTESGLKLIEVLAKHGSTQNHIASQLGITQNSFRKILGRSDNDDSKPRLAWERGRSQHEQDVVNRLLAHGLKNPISLIFYSKAKLGWRENEPAPTVQSNVQITYPAAMSCEEFYKMLGISGPVDTRLPAHDVSPKPKALPPAGDVPMYATTHTQKESENGK
jgi:hypothetical protein